MEDEPVYTLTETEDIEEINEDIDEVLEDTTSIDKKTTWLIYLWLLDKIAMFILLWLTLTIWR